MTTPIRRSAFCVNILNLRKLARRCRSKIKVVKTANENAGQAFQCMGAQPSRDTAIVMLVPRSNPAGRKSMQSARQARSYIFAPVSSSTEKRDSGSPHHRTPGEYITHPPGLSAKQRQPKSVTNLFRLRKHPAPATDGAGTARGRPPCPTSTASTLPNPRKDPVGPRHPPELHRSVQDCRQARTTGKRKTDRPQRAVRSSMRHAAVRTLSGAKSSVRDSDT